MNELDLSRVSRETLEALARACDVEDEAAAEAARARIRAEAAGVPSLLADDYTDLESRLAESERTAHEETKRALAEASADRDAFDVERIRVVQELDATHYELQQERAAHAQTRAELDELRGTYAEKSEQLILAQARVAEERRNYDCCWRDLELWMARATAAESALASARTLLDVIQAEVRHWEAADAAQQGSARACLHEIARRLSTIPAPAPSEPECSYVGRCNSSRCPKHGEPTP